MIEIITLSITSLLLAERIYKHYKIHRQKVRRATAKDSYELANIRSIVRDARISVSEKGAMNQDVKNANRLQGRKSISDSNIRRTPARL